MRVRLLMTLGLILLATPSRAQEGTRIDEAYDDYAAMLTRYVEHGRVDYAAWLEENPPAWERFLAWLERARPDQWSVSERRAFWINAYNARVIAGVLARYPIESVRDIGLLGGRLRGFFSRREHPVAGEMRTLDEIEKEILLAEPLWDDRIHWSLTCASLGCPWLRPEPYTSEQLDMQLDFQARTYLNGPAGHRIDHEKQRLYLTRIFEWYEDDFVTAAGSVRDYVARYLTGAALAAARDAAYEIKHLDYDWDLNDAP